LASNKQEQQKKGFPHDVPAFGSECENILVHVVYSMRQSVGGARRDKDFNRPVAKAHIGVHAPSHTAGVVAAGDFIVAVAAAAAVRVHGGGRRRRNAIGLQIHPHRASLVAVVLSDGGCVCVDFRMFLFCLRYVSYNTVLWSTRTALAS